MWQNLYNALHFVSITVTDYIFPNVPQQCMLFYDVTLPQLPLPGGVYVPTLNLGSPVTASTNRICHKWHYLTSEFNS